MIQLMCKHTKITLIQLLFLPFFVFQDNTAMAREVISEVMASRADAERVVNTAISQNPGSCSVELNTSKDLAVICLDDSEGWIGIYWRNGQMKLVKFTDREVGKLGLIRE